MMYGYGYGNGSSWWMLVVQVLVTALVITGIAIAVILVSRQLRPAARPGGNDARAILEARFARGDIDDGEFQRRADLLSKP